VAAMQLRERSQVLGGRSGPIRIIPPLPANASGVSTGSPPINPAHIANRDDVAARILQGPVGPAIAVEVDQKFI